METQGLVTVSEVSPMHVTGNGGASPPGGSNSGGAGDNGVCRMMTSPSLGGGHLLSPATSLVAGLCAEFDTAAAAITRAAAIDEGGGRSDDDRLYGTGDSNVDSGGLPFVEGNGDSDYIAADDDDYEDGMCNVCFARLEAVMPVACRHGLCTACAVELCRAIVCKPMLCPFCRRPVGNFVRIVKPEAGLQ